MIATLDGQGRLTIPARIRQAAHLEPGDSLRVEVSEEGILLRPCGSDAEDPARFWGPNWQEELATALADVAAGRTTYHDSTEEFFAALKSYPPSDQQNNGVTKKRLPTRRVLNHLSGSQSY